MRQHYVTIKDELCMAALYQAGWSEGQIALTYERPRSTVQAALNRQGIKRRRRGMQRGAQRLSNAEFELTANLYRTGKTIGEIADLLGRDYRAVHYRLVRAGVERRTPHESLRLRRQLATGT